MLFPANRQIFKSPPSIIFAISTVCLIRSGKKKRIEWLHILQLLRAGIVGEKKGGLLKKKNACVPCDFVMTEGVPSSSSDRFSHPSLGSRSARSAAMEDGRGQRQSESGQQTGKRMHASVPAARGGAGKKASTSSSTGTSNHTGITPAAEGAGGGRPGNRNSSARPSRSSQETTTGSSSETETDAERYFAHATLFFPKLHFSFSLLTSFFRMYWIFSFSSYYAVVLRVVYKRELPVDSIWRP